MKLYKVSGGGETFYSDSLDDIREYFSLPESDKTVFEMNETLAAIQSEIGGYLYQIKELRVCKGE